MRFRSTFKSMKPNATSVMKSRAKTIRCAEVIATSVRHNVVLVVSSWEAKRSKVVMPLDTARNATGIYAMIAMRRTLVGIARRCLTMVCRIKMRTYLTCQKSCN